MMLSQYYSNVLTVRAPNSDNITYTRYLSYMCHNHLINLQCNVKSLSPNHVIYFLYNNRGWTVAITPKEIIYQGKYSISLYLESLWHRPVELRPVAISNAIDG